jgi:putative acetyltransferase
LTTGDQRPEPVVIRTERPEDRAAVSEVLTRAFDQPDEAQLVDALRVDPAWIDQLSLVATAADVVVGHALLTRLTVGDRRALALAPVAVLPEQQRRGVGHQLVTELVRRAIASGERLVVVLGDPAYYSRFGFVPAAALGVTGPFVDSGDAFQVLPLAATRLVPHGQVRYAAAFGLP